MKRIVTGILSMFFVMCAAVLLDIPAEAATEITTSETWSCVAKTESVTIKGGNDPNNPVVITVNGTTKMEHNMTVSGCVKFVGTDNERLNTSGASVSITCDPASNVQLTIENLIFNGSGGITDVCIKSEPDEGYTHSISLNNATVQGYKSTDTGSICISGNSSLTMNNSIVKTANIGVNVGDSASFTMIGGSITNNITTYAVQTTSNSGTVTVGGTAVINNLYLGTGKTVAIDSTTPLSSGASIKITSETAPTDGNEITVTDTTDTSNLSYFSSYDSQYSTYYDSTSQAIKLTTGSSSEDTTTSAEESSTSTSTSSPSESDSSSENSPNVSDDEPVNSSSSEPDSSSSNSSTSTTSNDSSTSDDTSQTSSDSSSENTPDVSDDEPVNSSSSENTNSTGGNSTTTNGSSDNSSADNESSDGLPYIKNDSAIRGWDKIGKVIEKASDKDVVEIVMNGATVLPAEALQLIKDKNVTLVLELNSKISWRINGLGVKKAQETDLNVTEAEAAPEDAADLAKDKPTIYLTFAHEGDFGFEAVLEIKTDDDYSKKVANLFYKNGDEFAFAYDITIAEGVIQITMNSPAESMIVFANNAYNGVDYGDNPLMGASLGIAGLAGFSAVALFTHKRLRKRRKRSR